MKIVVLPGLDGTGQLLGDVATCLRAGHDVEVISYPTAMSSYAELGTWVMDHLPQQDFAIVAESFSGPLAIDIAAEKPDGLQAVVFVATFAHAPRQVPKPLIWLASTLPVPPIALAWLSLPFVLGGSGTAKIRANYRRALKMVPRSSILSRLVAVLNVDKRDALSKISVPCAYLRAGRDRLVPQSASDDFAPICEAVISIDAPHFLLQARPAEAAILISDFLPMRQQ